MHHNIKMLTEFLKKKWQTLNYNNWSILVDLIDDDNNDDNVSLIMIETTTIKIMTMV